MLGDFGDKMEAGGGLINGYLEKLLKPKLLLR